VSRRRRVLLLVTAGALVLSTAGVGGFSSVAADRSGSVAVVGDDAAYLGVERSVATIDGNETLQVTVRNRFPSVDELTVTVDVGDESQTRTVTGSHTFEFPADCDASVHVTADGPGTYVELTRPVPCDADSVGAGEVAGGEDEGEEAEQESDDDTGEEDEGEEAAEESGDEANDAKAETTTASESDDDAADE
jgi:hypothetical protein